MDTMRAPKRAHEDDGASGVPSEAGAHASPARSKLAKLDSTSSTSSNSKSFASDDFSSVVKNKLSSYTRTGQACDRCKVRKIRCDALPEGCSHCLGQNLECYVTDRISGRTERRGYLQELEREKTAMARHIEQLQTLLAERGGVEVLPWRWSPYAPVYPPGVVLDGQGRVVEVKGDDGESVDSGEGSDGPQEKRQWTCMGSVWWRPSKNANSSNTATTSLVTTTTGRASSTTASLSTPNTPTYTYTPTPSSPSSALQSCPVDSYLGVYADRAPLNSVNGTQVSILGTLLDIDAADTGIEPEPSAIYREPTGLYNRSLGSFLRSAMNINPSLDSSIELPSRSDAFEYSEWYFLMVHPFAPILHKPTYLALLTRIYDDPKFTPTTSELVIVHMVFAAIYFQYGVRNREELTRQIHLHDLSNKHYHWALSKFYYIASDFSVTAVQALVLITLYTRAFPKPSCGSTIAMLALTKAINLGLHRSAGIPAARTTLTNEMRKRAWWGALMLAATLNGRLGRPMPIRVEDFDTELPVAIGDEYLTEQGITDPSMIGKASFLVGLHAFQFTPLYMEMFSHLYGVRRDPRRYAPLVRDLEAQYRNIQARLPAELHVDKCKPASLMYALYAQAVSLEFLLCLHHPSACMTTDPQVFAENTRICEETARTLLKHVQKLLELKSLDTTWYQMSVYCAAMFSTLAAAWERRKTVTAAEMERLQDETSIWLSIIAEIGLLTGASENGQPFNRKLTQICARTIFGILRDMPAGARNAVMAHNARAIQGRGIPINGQAQLPGSSSATNPSQTASVHADHNINNGRRSPPGNIDSVALHLETQARLKLEGRGQLSPVTAPQQQQQPPPQQQHPSQFHQPSMQMPTTTEEFVMTSPFPQQQQTMNGAGYDQQTQHQQPPQGQPAHSQQPLMSFTPSALGAPANPWTNWTASIADSQRPNDDRFTSADALLDLSMLHQRLAPGPGPGPGPAPSPLGVTDGNEPATADNGLPTMMVPVGPVNTLGQQQQQQQAQQTSVGTHSAQWPLILFQ
ncbi:hypothetical protein Sste5346_002123 [Sporothrix stenoceras]|uniref:Zn(2)-C6 fungal-type domain-containing protein n=1 Tax=Sporothrix stenoceras TaxID=5173 RepID=A0ABR3ZK20_9PEZI